MDEPLRDELAPRVRSVLRSAGVDLWQVRGARIVLVNTPCADWGRHRWFEEEDGDMRARSVNVNVYMSLVGVAVADLFSRVCPLGRYRSGVEGLENGRPDGVHFSDEASTALARNWLGPMVLDAGRAAQRARDAQRGQAPSAQGG